MKKRLALAACALLIVLAISSPGFGQRSSQAQVRQSAQSWLGLVDSGRYAQSWDAASPEFKAKISKARWEAMLTRARAPLGKEESRVFRIVHEADNPPNSPPGKYEFVQYSTAYRKQPRATETVALIQGKDGKWRVIEYAIHSGELRSVRPPRPSR
ncbi:MAG: DUF4019 domain-containing protein [Terriglobia bacterium]